MLCVLFAVHSRASRHTYLLHVARMRLLYVTHLVIQSLQLKTRFVHAYAGVDTLAMGVLLRHARLACQVTVFQLQRSQFLHHKAHTTINIPY